MKRTQDWSERLGLERPRAKSLIVTIYGDSLLPRGGRCWLSDLIRLVGPLGVNERMTRTAVFRLVQDGLLEAERVGRQSRYTLTSKGWNTFDSAQSRIYGNTNAEKSESWTTILVPKSLESDTRTALVRALGWIGYAELSPGLLGAPQPAKQAQDVLRDMDMAGHCMLFDSRPVTPDLLPGLVFGAWSLETLASDYETYLNTFDALTVEEINADQDAFELRTLLIHAYRRILLRDPALPEDQLPKDWPGHHARVLTATLYHQLSPRVDQFLRVALKETGAIAGGSHRFP